MKLLWLVSILVHRCHCNENETVQWEAPWIEKKHDPGRYTSPRPRITFGGAPLPDPQEAPDFRLEEQMLLAYKPNFYAEENRPYRLSPHFKQTQQWAKYKPEDNMQFAGCYCTTVYKRLIPLAGCALITTRHVLTTATSTYLVLRDRKHYDVLENVLGAWYDTNHDNNNSSMYLSPARIHFHPLWNYPEHANRSHPMSFTFDLAVWAATYTVYGWYLNTASAVVCSRASSNAKEFETPAPSGNVNFIIVGFQFMYSYKRKPTPWHKYGVKTTMYTEPCPKTEWGWFICIPGDWASFGVESGAALHRSDTTWKFDGLIGMAAFSMRLRSVELTHYFTVLDTHPVLDFLIDSYEGRIPYAWLDKRFENTKQAAPKLKKGFYLHRDYSIGDQHQYGDLLWN